MARRSRSDRRAFAIWGRVQRERRTADSGRRTADSGQRTADGGQRTADGGQRTADGGQRTADGGQRTADSGQRTADSGQRTADSGQRTADGGQRTADSDCTGGGGGAVSRRCRVCHRARSGQGQAVLAILARFADSGWLRAVAARALTRSPRDGVERGAVREAAEREFVMLRIVDEIVEMVGRVHGIARVVSRQDADLAKQMKRSSASVGLNAGEGLCSRNGNRTVRLESAMCDFHPGHGGPPMRSAPRTPTTASSASRDPHRVARPASPAHAPAPPSPPCPRRSSIP